MSALMVVVLFVGRPEGEAIMDQEQIPSRSIRCGDRDRNARSRARQSPGFRQDPAFAQAGGGFYTATCAYSHLQEVIELVRPFRSASAPGTPARFDLDNGAEMLSPWFDDVMRYDYPDRYEFTQVVAAPDYVLSGTEVQKIITAEKRAALRKILEEMIARRGSIVVLTDKGLFVARHPGLSKK